MYKREFENLLRIQKIPKSLLLYGVCDYQISHFGDEVIGYWSGGVEEVTTFYFDAYDFKTLKQHLSQNSLFGNKNIAVIKVDKTVAKKELDALVDICNKSENAYLLVQCYGDEKKSANMAKSFSKKKQSDFVRFFKLNTGEAMQMLSLEAKKIGLNIQGYALQHLLMLHNEDISLAVNELPKLSILEDEVKKNDIDELVFGMGEVNLEDFMTNILDKKDIKADFQTLSESGQYDEVFILNSIENYISQLFAFHAYIKLNGTFDARAILGYPLPPQLARKRADQSMRMTIEMFRDTLEALTNAEYTLKKGAFSDKNTFLLSTLLKVQSLLG